MTVIRTGIAPVYLRVISLRLGYGRLASSVHSKVSPVLFGRQVLAIFMMNFVITVRLRIVVNVIFLHGLKLISPKISLAKYFAVRETVTAEKGSDRYLNRVAPHPCKTALTVHF